MSDKIITVIVFGEVFIATIGPFGLGWWISRKFKVSWRVFLIGGATFILSQVVHIPMVIPFNQAFAKGSFNLMVYATGIGLMAGLCEEIARYLVYKYWLKKYEWKDGLMFGAGHGGIECTIFVGILLFITLLNMIALKNGDLNSIKGLEESQIPFVKEQIKAFWGMNWWMPFAALFERACAITFHIAMSFMVLISIKKRKILYLGGAVLFHSALDFIAAVGVVNKWPVWLLEGSVFIFAILAFAYIIYLKINMKEILPKTEVEIPKPPEDIMLKVSELSKSFGDLTAVNQISFEVKKGEVFGFLGPNGAGKTTTVRMLNALISSSSGQAWVNGYKLGKNDDEIRASCGILTETPGVYPRLSAWKNLEFYARLYGVNDVPGEVEKYLRMLDLWERRDDMAGTFSKGMRQKLAIARALLNNPPVIFLDEPTSALDPEAASMVRDFIIDLKKHGHTVFICTHNLDEADRLCDKIGVMKTKLIKVDTPGSLREQLYGKEVIVKLKEYKKDINTKLMELPFVKSVTSDEKSMRISVENPDENNPGLIKKIIELGGEILYVEKASHSLEEVYFSLIKEGEQNEIKLEQSQSTAG